MNSLPRVKQDPDLIVIHTNLYTSMQCNTYIPAYRTQFKWDSRHENGRNLCYCHWSIWVWLIAWLANICDSLWNALAAPNSQNSAVTSCECNPLLQHQCMLTLYVSSLEVEQSEDNWVEICRVVKGRPRVENMNLFLLVRRQNQTHFPHVGNHLCMKWIAVVLLANVEILNCIIIVNLYPCIQTPQ